MSRLHRILFAVSLVTGFVSGVRAQVPVTSVVTSNVTIVPNDGNTIVVYHRPLFGLERTSHDYSGSAAKVLTNLSGINASILTLGEPGYQVNVCISLTSEMVSRDGSGGKLRGGVYLVDSHDGLSNRTSAQQSGSDGEMTFLLSAMSPDASAMHNGAYNGAIDVVLTYN